MCVCGTREFLPAMPPPLPTTRASERAKGNRCDEGSGAAKIMGCVASRVVRFFAVRRGWKDKLVRIITVKMSKEIDVLTWLRATNLSILTE